MIHRLRIIGDSMLPTLRPDDRVVVVRVPNAWLRVGQLVAVRDPRQPSRLLTKRIFAMTPEGIDVRGDNPAASTDSRTFGPVPHSAVVGRVIGRYYP